MALHLPARSALTQNSHTADKMELTLEQPALLAEATDSQTARDKAVVCSDLFSGIRASAPFSVLYADPPWMYEGNLHDGRGYARNHYDTQKPDWIARLPVSEVMAWDSVCFMWATYPKLQEALYVLRAWGYEYKTVAFTWVKINPSTKRHYFGMGQYTRANSEICLLGTRGQSLERKDKGVPQLLECNVTDHSRKPDEARDRIVRLYGDVPRLEMFARRDATDMHDRFTGWTLWGNECGEAMPLNDRTERRGTATLENKKPL